MILQSGKWNESIGDDHMRFNAQWHAFQHGLTGGNEDLKQNNKVKYVIHTRALDFGHMLRTCNRTRIDVK